MADLTSKTTTELVADSGNGVQDWATRHANHAEADPGHGGWGRVDPGDSSSTPPPPDPTIGSLAPNSGTAGTPATVVVTGTNFESTSVVEVDDATVTTVYTSATSLTATFTPATAGTKQFSVRNASGEESNNVAFTVA